MRVRTTIETETPLGETTLAELAKIVSLHTDERVTLWANYPAENRVVPGEVSAEELYAGETETFFGVKIDLTGEDL